MRMYTSYPLHFFVAQQIAKSCADFVIFNKIMVDYFSLTLYGVSEVAVKQALIDHYSSSLQMFEAFEDKIQQQFFIHKYVEFSLHSVNHDYIIMADGSKRRGWTDELGIIK